MPATVANYNAALKEVWTQDTLESQLYNGNEFLDVVSKKKGVGTGRYAVTPVMTNRNGGYSAVPLAGSASLNAAGNVGSAQAQWNYTQHWQQIKLETAVIAQTDGDELAVADAVDTEVTGALDHLRKQLSRQIFGAGDALIAQCTTTGGSTTINLLTTGFGPDALLRGWLHPGLTVDVGTAANETFRVADSAISAISETNSTITLGSSITTASTDFVSIANGRSGTTSNEMNGLQNLVSLTTTLGGIAPATEPTWVASDVDSTTTAFSLDDLYREVRKVKQKVGKKPTQAVTSLKQEENAYKLLQMQVRFAGDAGVQAGNVDQVMIAKIPVLSDPDCPDRLWYNLTMDNLFMVRRDKPQWTNALTGGDILSWNQNTTAMVGGLYYFCQLATNRRNAHSGFSSLTA